MHFKKLSFEMQIILFKMFIEKLFKLIEHEIILKWEKSSLSNFSLLNYYCSIIKFFWFKTSDTYLQLLENELTGFLDHMNSQERHKLWCIPDGCPAVSARIVSELLNGEFGNKWLGRDTDPRWLPLPPYLTPIDVFFEDI